ncbi:Type IV secretory system Conjugative DNA transfer [Lachnospiraceae bacterium]|nr:Type IV secretory system Conjugative DNA transfer [Lachnospiraceae bacterium]
MIKRYGWKYVIRYYSVIPFTVIGVLLIILNPFIQKYCFINLGISEFDKNYDTYRLVIEMISLAFWIYFVFCNSRNQRYKYLTGRRYGKDHAKYKRSYSELVEYFKDADPYKIDENKLERKSWREAEGMILGQTKEHKLINVETEKDGKNYFIFGLPSSGKTAGPLICSILRFGMDHPLSETDKSSRGSVFCIDLKGDIWKATHKYRNIKSFNLMDPQHSCHYNPFDGIDQMTMDERCNFIESIGFNIIPTGTGDAGKYFSDTALDYWCGIALYLLAKNINTSFPEVIQAVLSGNPIDWVKEIVSSDCVEAKRRLASKYGEQERNLSGAYATLAQNCRRFANDTLYFLLGNDSKYEYISPQTLEDGSDCYVQIDQAEMANYSAVLSMIVQGFLMGFLKRERNPKAGRLSDGSLRPCLLCLDEFAQLTTLKYDIVASAFMTLRSKNISIVCAMQSKSSIAEMFHSENACNSLIDCVTTFCFLSIQEVSTREWASKLIGNRKVLRISNSLSTGSKSSRNSGKSVQETTEPIIDPADFGNLIDRENGKDEIVIYSKGKYIIADKLYYYR